MPIFPLPVEQSDFYDHAIEFASAVQNALAEHGGCKTPSSEALNVLGCYAILTHRGIRSLCEEDWSPHT